MICNRNAQEAEAMKKSERPLLAGSVEKPQNFPVGEIISDLTISKILHTEGDRNLTISSDRQKNDPPFFSIFSTE
jgi:hypothetical protein